MNEHYVIAFFYTTIFTCLSFVFAKNALHMFQQQRYELRRYTKWLFNKNNIHFSTALIYIVLEIIVYLINYFKIIKNDDICLLISLAISVIFTIYSVIVESKKQYIKDLVLTKRVKRQIVVYTIIIILANYLFLRLFEMYYFTGVFSIYAPYLLIYIMAIITYPIEEAIKKYYENDARNKLDNLSHLKKIGITGSYGKTSTKNIINDIISDSLFTLITPSSYNTPMGITRTIREQLKPIHEVFVCEMGADKIGDISYLMKFVKPKYGVVTSIGPQHLATFKSIDNIINEKMQEIEMLPADGVGFINLDNEYISKYHIKNTCKIVSVGITNKDADIVANNIKYSSEGSSFTVKINGKNYKFTTCLLGKHNITNILIGIGIGLELGISIDEIVRNVACIRQIEHRLQVKRINDFTIIDDAFNSNPVGSKMAIDVLQLMHGKRIIITPGMIDLGSKQDSINYEFGEYMCNRVDYVLLVGEKQTKPISNGLKDAGFDMNNVKTFNNVKEALYYAYNRFSRMDTILLENDLPDAFNV